MEEKVLYAAFYDCGLFTGKVASELAYQFLTLDEFHARQMAEAFDKLANSIQEQEDRKKRILDQMRVNSERRLSNVSE